MHNTPNPRPAAPPSVLTSICWNLCGQVLPVVVAIATVPTLIAQLGVERFGALTIAWMLIGYFSLFDLGLGRAITRVVAKGLDRAEPRGDTLVATGLTLLVGLGLGAGAVVALLAEPLAAHVLRISDTLHGETVNALYLLAAALPLVFFTSGLGGIVDGQRRFDMGNLIRIPLGIWTFASPLVVLPFSQRLDHVVAALVLGRVLATLAYLAAAIRLLPAPFARPALRLRGALALLSFGGWVTVSNVVGPLMVYFDRFVLGAILTVAAVAYYTTPFEVVARFGYVSDAVVAVLFPALATYLATDRRRAVELFDRGEKAVFFMLLPIAFLGATFAPDALRLWIDESFARESYRVAQWLCAGILANGLAKVAFVAIQAQGRPELTAKLHLAELPFYLVALVTLINAFGLVGAAVAWTLRAIVDLLALLYLAARVVPEFTPTAWRVPKRLVLGLALLYVGATLDDVSLRLGFAAAVTAVFGALTWFVALSEADRARIRLAAASILSWR